MSYKLIDIEPYQEYPVLFGLSSGKALKKTFPEIANTEEFRDLTNQEILFAWYIGCKSSPIDPELTDEIRYKQAAIEAFKFDEVKREQYGRKQLPENVVIAIEKFSKYSPNARLLVLRTLQLMHHNLLKQQNVDIEKEFVKTDDTGAIIPDWDTRIKFIASMKTSAEALQTILAQIENGLGLEKKNLNKESGMKLIDKYHQLKKETA